MFANARARKKGTLGTAIQWKTNNNIKGKQIKNKKQIKNTLIDPFNISVFGIKRIKIFCITQTIFAA